MTTNDQVKTKMTDLVVQRRARLMALVAVTALSISLGYLWRFGQTGGGVSLLVGGALGLVAIFHGLACGDARTPLLVADETGLRVRLGGDWTGIPWTHVERIEVDERGRIRDGHVAVIVAESAGELENARWRSRLGAQLNRWFYDAPLVVPYGLTTTVSVVDVTSTLCRLADGRAPVVMLDVEVELPEPTVALNPRPPASTVRTDPAEAAEAVEATEPRGWSWHETPPAAASTAPDAEQTGPVPTGGKATRRPRLPLIAAREPSPTMPLAKLVAALRSHPARREDVTLPVRREPVTDGTSALSDPYRDEVTAPLPEISHLRRRDESQDRYDLNRSSGEPVDNVGLIIDATTDLSARAMSKVRRAAPLAAPTNVRDDPRVTLPVTSGDDAADVGATVIGGTVHGARTQLGLSVDELAERTRIRPYVIESIEVDDFAPCGGDFYARGHLRMLARVLGLEVEPLMAAYDDTFAASPINPRAVFDAELSTGSTGLIRGGASGANWGGLIAAVLVLVLIWGVAKYFADSTELPGAQAVPTQNSKGLGSPGPGNVKQPAPSAEPRVATVRLAAVGGDSRVVVKNRRGSVVFQGMLTDGKAHLSRGLAPLHVMAADGGVVRLGAPGHKPALMGEAELRARHQVAAPPSR